MPWQYHRDDGELTVFDHEGRQVASTRTRVLHVFGGALGYVRHQMREAAVAALERGDREYLDHVLVAAEFDLIEQVDEPPAPPADGDSETDTESPSADGTGAGLGPDRDVPDEGIGPSDRADDADEPDDTAAEEGWSFEADPKED
jgi:hypothetical protein